MNLVLRSTDLKEFLPNIFHFFEGDLNFGTGGRLLSLLLSVFETKVSRRTLFKWTTAAAMLEDGIFHIFGICRFIPNP
jgi:hypothetical protein